MRHDLDRIRRYTLDNPARCGTDEYYVPPSAESFPCPSGHC